MSAQQSVLLGIGWWFHKRTQRRVRESGAYAAAAQLRNEGVDVRVARLLVAYRPIPVLVHSRPRINLRLAR